MCFFLLYNPEWDESMRALWWSSQRTLYWANSQSVFTWSYPRQGAEWRSPDRLGIRNSKEQYNKQICLEFRYLVYVWVYWYSLTSSHLMLTYSIPLLENNNARSTVMVLLTKVIVFNIHKTIFPVSFPWCYCRWCIQNLFLWTAHWSFHWSW